MEYSKYKKVGNFYYALDDTPLGTGAFAQVFKGYEEGNESEPVAIKLITLQTLQEHKEFSGIFDREVNILKSITGPHILNLKKVVKTYSGNLYIITSLCNGGSLEARLAKEGKLPEDQAIKILKEVSRAFVDIENLNLKNGKGEKIIVMHRDIKPGNILFHDGVTKIADFGFAKFIEMERKNQKAQHTTLGTPFYMSPEILMERAYSAKCDIWSMGIVFYEMLTGRVPFETASIYELIRKVKQERVEFPNHVSKECQDLIEKMLKVDEAARIDWKEILQHPAVTGKSVEDIKPAKKNMIRIIEDSAKNVMGQEQKSSSVAANTQIEKISPGVQKSEQKKINRIEIISETKESAPTQQTDKKTKIKILEVS